MGDYMLEVTAKSKDRLLERYADESSAKKALSDLVKEVNRTTGVVVSNGGGIAIARANFESAKIPPAQS